MPCALSCGVTDQPPPVNSNNQPRDAADLATYDGPPPPLAGQVFVDSSGGFWKVARLTIAENPKGFYLVHLSFGPSPESVESSMVLGPREFAALVRDRDLRSQLQSVPRR